MKFHNCHLANGGMIVTGGTDNTTAFKSSLIVYLNESANTDGPELPEPRYGHCLAYDKDDDVFFVTGGFTSNSGSSIKNTAWNFNDKEKFTLNGTTTMKETRGYHGCGIFRSKKHNERPLLVTAGSLGETGSNTCEFYDYTKHGSKWQLCSKFISSFLVFINQK